MTFWVGFGSGSGSTDPCLWLMDPDADPDPAIFVINLPEMLTKNKFLKKILLFTYFSYFFCLVIGSRSGAGSGSIPLTDGSGAGSRRPKSIRIRWIRIRIRIRNTDNIGINTSCCLGRGVYPGAGLRGGAGLAGRPGRLLPRGGVPRPRLRAARHSHRAPLPTGAVRPPPGAARRCARLSRPLHWLVSGTVSRDGFDFWWHIWLYGLIMLA